MSSKLVFDKPELLESSNDLVQALNTEKDVELENSAENEEENLRLQQWPEQNGFKVYLEHGRDRVQLEKKLSDSETLRVFFSVSDMASPESSIEEEPEIGEDGEEIGEEIDSPISATVVVEKSKGCLLFDCLLQGDLVHVETVTPFADKNLALDETAEGENQRLRMYEGPSFESLDPSVQSSLQNYLDARGVDGDFALFVQEYAAYLENKEYIRWIDKVTELVQ